MSRGNWNYINETLAMEMFSPTDNDWGSDIDVNAFPKGDPLEDIELSSILYDMFKVMYIYDSYVSGDCGKGSYNKIKKQFKDKWLNTKNLENTLYELIDFKTSKMRGMLHEVFIGQNYCKDCKEFKKLENSNYGECKWCKGYLIEDFEDICEHFSNKSEEE